MPLQRFEGKLGEEVRAIEAAGTAKAEERVVTAIVPATGEHGPRFRLRGEGERAFLRMNSNSYLGLQLRPELIAAEERAVHEFGVGPGAVRFISGTYAPHVALEAGLAAFHGREGCLLASSAYSTVLGVLVSLTTPETLLISDELNHNCIINAMKLSRPKDRKVYPHLDLAALARALEEGAGGCESALVITDGVFSMRGDYAPLDKIAELVARHDARYPRGALLIVDDSHGVGAYGDTGRGTEEVCGLRGENGRALRDAGVDVLVGTLGKAFAVNGGYVVSSAGVVRYLRERNPLYIYTNPITTGEAAAALASLTLLQSSEGPERLRHLRALTAKFEAGLQSLGFETIPSPHPVTPLVVRDTERTRRYVRHLFARGILATGLAYPVVPRGEELIRFQLCADLTVADVDFALGVVAELRTLD